MMSQLLLIAVRAALLRCLWCAAAAAAADRELCCSLRHGGIEPHHGQLTLAHGDGITTCAHITDTHYRA
jgi:hypothetical protein